MDAQAACEGKEPFDDPALARKVALRRETKAKKQGSVYKCRVCRRWHIGQSNRKKSERKRPLPRLTHSS